LIFHLGALGDFIITWPLALAMARLYPQSRVYYVTHGQKGALAEKVLRVESLDIEAGWHALFTEHGPLPEPATRALTGAHTVVSFLADEQSVWANEVRRLSPDVNLLTLSTTAPDGFSGHITEFLLSQLSKWPAAQTGMSQILKSIAERGLLASKSPGDYLLIHPGSGSPAKNWPAERFCQLARHLKESGRSVRVILGDVELERWPRETIRALESAAQIARPANLIELYWQIAGASALIGNDSGPAHLAGVVGIPTITLFASAKTIRWRPLGPRVQAMEGPLDQIDVPTVMAAIEKATRS
jgi:ADP-heptose:LPS heptosyltransferase